MVDNVNVEGNLAPAANPFRNTEAMNRIYRYQDGLNDDMLADIYNDQNDQEPLFRTVDDRRFRHPITINGIEIHETIGVEKADSQYKLYRYKDGYYDICDAKKVFGQRVGDIIHQLRIVGEGVLLENPEPDRDDHSPAATSTRAARNRAKKLIEYAEKAHNSGTRNSIYRRIAERNSIPADIMDTGDMISAPNGTFIVNWSTSKPGIPFTPGSVTFDPHFHPENLNTMILGVPRVPDAVCPEWIEFVTEALSYDENGRRTDLENVAKDVRLMRGLAGYWLVRGNLEQLVTVFMGSGGSGKGTIMEVLCGVYGSYAAKSRKELVIPNGDRISADIGKTVRKHLAYVDEFGSNDVIVASKIRYMTNKTITVEEKYMNPYEAQNNMKLLLVTNYDNRFDDNDGTLLRRLVFLFFYKPEPKVLNPLLSKQMLDAEGPGILNWCIDGLNDILAQPNGIRDLVPEHLKEAAKQRLMEHDRLTMYLDACFKKTGDPKDFVLLKTTFNDMVRYFKANGEEPPAANVNWWSRILRSKYYKITTSGGYSVIRGVKFHEPIIIETIHQADTVQEKSDEPQKKLCE